MCYTTPVLGTGERRLMSEWKNEAKFAEFSCFCPGFSTLVPSLSLHTLASPFSLARNCPGLSLAEKALYSPRCLLPNLA